MGGGPEASVLTVANSVSAAADRGLSTWMALGLCASLALLYVLLLYLPPLILNLPHPRSLQQHLLRRFSCVALASVLSPFICLSFLPIPEHLKLDLSAELRIFGLRTDHVWQAVLFPLLLTIILYLGPLVMAAIDELSESQQVGLWSRLGVWLARLFWRSRAELRSNATDVVAWRNYVMAPFSEEFVFRACMIPLLLCGGFSNLAIILICPIIFSLAHLHHFWELIYRQKYTKHDAALVVASQLLYTTIFGWYATFLYLRTGHLIAPVVAHVFCNYMGLPDLATGLCSRNKLLPLSFVAGLASFSLLLLPASAPKLYNDGFAECHCWLGFCR